jgi:PAS domain S-box-containing protein
MTDQMKIEARWLANILDQTLDCVFIFDAKTLKFSYINDGAKRQTGYSERELLDLTPVDIKPFFEKSEFEALLLPLKQGNEKSIVFETVHQHKTGFHIPVEIFLQYIDLDDSKPSFVAIVRDITERNKSKHALQESELLFGILAENVPVGIFQTDQNGKCIYVNDCWSEITGISASDAMGNGWRATLHPMDSSAVLAGWKELIDQKQPLEMDYRFLHPNGKETWVEGKTVPLLDKNQNLNGYIGTIADITERRQMEQKLQETQKLESLGLLASGIAHDFNNLLTSILGNASLASMETSNSSPVQKYLERINEGSVRAAELCKQLLAYSGKGKLVVQNLSLNEVVEDTAHLLEVSISKTALLRFDLHTDLPAIEADPTQIRQVLMNLVINASEAIGSKSGIIGLSTGLTRVDEAYLGGTMLAEDLEQGTYVYLEVSDTGSGMDAETLSRVFDPFFTTKFEGRGLGLSASLGIMRGHKGALKVYSEPGRGTTFKLLFPTVLGVAKPLPLTNNQSSLAQGQGCLLIVDDEESIRATLAQMAQALGYTFSLASDGREAVQVFASEPDRYSLVLMDLTMPHLNGEEAFAELRKIRANVPVVLMSGFNKEKAISNFTGKGLSGFIEKPFTMSTLSSALSQALAAK